MGPVNCEDSISLFPESRRLTISDAYIGQLFHHAALNWSVIFQILLAGMCGLNFHVYVKKIYDLCFKGNQTC